MSSLGEFLFGYDAYRAGYNAGIRDAVRAVERLKRARR